MERTLLANQLFLPNFVHRKYVVISLLRHFPNVNVRCEDRMSETLSKLTLSPLFGKILLLYFLCATLHFCTYFYVVALFLDFDITFIIH